LGLSAEVLWVKEGVNPTSVPGIVSWYRASFLGTGFKNPANLYSVLAAYANSMKLI